MLLAVRKGLPANKGIGYPASSKFYDGRIHDFGIMRYMQEREGLKVWSVLQPNDTKGLEKLAADNLKNDTHNTLASVNEETFNKIKSFLGTPSSVLLICPQGTRDPVMQEPSKSISILLRHEERNEAGAVLVLPFSITGTENILRKGQIVLNPFAKATIEVCPPLSYEEIMTRTNLLGVTASHAMMMDIAVRQPRGYWGAYTSELEGMMQKTGVQDPFKALQIITCKTEGESIVSSG